MPDGLSTVTLDHVCGNGCLCKITNSIPIYQINYAFLIPTLCLPVRAVTNHSDGPCPKIENRFTEPAPGALRHCERSKP